MTLLNKYWIYSSITELLVNSRIRMSIAAILSLFKRISTQFFLKTIINVSNYHNQLRRVILKHSGIQATNPYIIN